MSDPRMDLGGEARGLRRPDGSPTAGRDWPRGWLTSWQVNGGVVPLDIFEEEDALVVCAALAGARPDATAVTIESNVLTIVADVGEVEDQPERRYFLREFRPGRVDRSVILPYPVEDSQISMTMDNGLLTLRLPKKRFGSH